VLPESRNAASKRLLPCMCAPASRSGQRAGVHDIMAKRVHAHSPVTTHFLSHLSAAMPCLQLQAQREGLKLLD
jgi:hypothetical protein